MRKPRRLEKATNQLNWYRRIMIIISFGLLFMHINAQVYGDFPYYQPFTSGAQPAEVSLLSPQTGMANATTFISNGVQLTPAANTKFGAFYINNRQFSSINGVHIEFEYGMYGGNGADGISMFLFDASVASPVIGANGGALGYAFNRANNSYTSLRQSGLTGAYLGIGLDAYGNNKRQVFQGDQRANGVVNSIFTQGASSVTLRGAKGTPINAAIGLGDGYTGYPVLTTQSTLSGTVGAATINPADGSYSTAAGLSDNFDLRTTTLGLTPSDPNYRKAFIELLPNPSGGFNVTVKIQHGSTLTTVINNYWYKTSYTYIENANPQVTDYNTSSTQGSNTSQTLAAVAPSYFRIGFGASTGGLNDIHLIRNLEVSLPYAAECVNDNDALSLCANTTGSVAALSNDFAYAGVGIPTASVDNIDKTSFRFIDAAGAPQGQSYTVSGVGVWVYNSSTGLVSFTPIAGYTGITTIRYDIKGLTAPYNDDAYRSTPATITAIVNPLPTINGVTSLCVGSTTQLTGSATASTTNPWVSGNTSVATVSNTGLVTAVSAGSSTITYTNSNGCSTATTVTVNALPIVPTASVTLQPTCSISTGTITVTAPTGAGHTYSVDGTNYQTGTTFNGLSTGSYSVTVKNGDGCISAALPLTVNAQPTTPAQPLLSSVTQPTCSTPNGSFTITNYNAANTYTFSPAEGVVNTAGTVVAPAGTYTVTATSGTCTSVASASVTVNAQPATPAQPLLGAVTQPTCSVATGSFMIDNYDASFAYTVTPSAGVTISSNTITAPVGTYQVTATLGSCTSDASSNVIIYAQPTTPTATINSVDPLCANSTPVQLAGSPAGGIFSGIGINIAGLFSPTVAGVGNHTITYTYTNQYGCSAVATTSVQVTPAPSLSIAPATQSICSGGQAAFTASGDNGGIVTWTSNYFGLSGTGTTFNTGTLFNRGTSPLILTLNATVTAGSCADNTNATVTVLPEPRVTVVPSSAVVCFYEIPHFTLRSILSGTTINWQLINNADSSIVSSGTGSDNITLFSAPVPAGSYTLKVTGTKDGCSSAVVNVSLTVN